MALRDLIVTLLIFGLLPFALARPYIGVLLWSWIGYMNPHRLTWGFAATFPFAQIVAIVTLVSVLFSREKKDFPITPVTIVWLLFLAWMGIATLFALAPDDALQQANKVAKIQLVFFVMYMVMGSPQRIRLMIWVIVISIGFFGVKGGIFTILTGGAHRVYGPPNTFIGGNNEIALAMLMVVPLMNYLRVTVTQHWLRWAMGGAMLLTIISALGSQSRGALLAFLAVLGFLWLKSSYKLWTGLLSVVLLISVFAFMPADWHQRMQSISEFQQDESAMGRINAWYASINIAASHVTGGGFDVLIADRDRIFAEYAPNPNDWADSHSIYFEILAEHGFVGLLLFLLLFTMAFFTGSWIIRNTRDRTELSEYTHMARMVQASLVAYAAGGAFLGLAYFDLPYHLVLLMVLARRVVENRLLQQQEALGGAYERFGYGEAKAP